MNNIKTYTDSLNEAESQEVLNGRLLGAAQEGNLSNVKDLLDRGAEIDARTNLGSTPLHFAAENGHTDTARLLLDRGAEPDARNEYGRTPLHWAVSYGNRGTTRLLIQHGADPFKAFDGPEEIIKFFKGDIDWMPEDLKTKLKRMQRGKSAFGM